MKPVYFDTRTGGLARCMTGAAPAFITRDEIDETRAWRGYVDARRSTVVDVVQDFASWQETCCQVEYIGYGPLQGKTALAAPGYRGEPAPEGFAYLQFDELGLTLDGVHLCYGWHLFQTAHIKVIK